MRKHLKLFDILTIEEKEIIDEYEESMNKALTKRGVDKYYNKIFKLLSEAKERYEDNDTNKKE